MKFRNNLPSEEEVKKTDMVDCLERLGLKPAKNSRNDFWYLSAFRDKTTPSFKVKRNLSYLDDSGKGKVFI